MQEDIEYYLQSKTFDIGPKIYNKYRNLKQVKRSQWVSHNIDDPESVSEHTFSTWMMAMLFLPEVTNDEGYNKKEILDMCSEYIYIDMNKSCESLNVGVATSIILYELDK